MCILDSAFYVNRIDTPARNVYGFLASGRLGIGREKRVPTGGHERIQATGNGERKESPSLYKPLTVDSDKSRTKGDNTTELLVR